MEICTVKLASSVSPFKVGQIPTITYSKLVSIMINMFSINSVKLHSVFLVKNTFYYSQDQFFVGIWPGRIDDINSMHYGSISGVLQNGIFLRDSILLHVKDVSLKDIKRWVYDHFIEWHVIPDILPECFAKNVISISSIVTL